MTFRTQIHRLGWIGFVILITIFGIAHSSWADGILIDDARKDFKVEPEGIAGARYFYEPPTSELPNPVMEAQAPCFFGCMGNSNKSFMENIDDVRKVLGATLFISGEKFKSNLKEAAKLIGDKAAIAALHNFYRNYTDDPRTKKMIRLAEGKPPYSEQDVNKEGNCFSAVKEMLMTAGFSKTKLNGAMAKNAGPELESLGFRNIFDSESPGPLKSCGDGPLGSICVYAPKRPDLRRRYGSGSSVEAAGHIEVYTGKSYSAQYSGKNPYDSYKTEYKLIGVYVIPPPSRQES